MLGLLEAPALLSCGALSLLSLPLQCGGSLTCASRVHRPLPSVSNALLHIRLRHSGKQLEAFCLGQHAVLHVAQRPPLGYHAWSHRVGAGATCKHSWVVVSVVLTLMAVLCCIAGLILAITAASQRRSRACCFTCIAPRSSTYCVLHGIPPLEFIWGGYCAFLLLSPRVLHWCMGATTGVGAFLRNSLGAMAWTVLHCRMVHVPGALAVAPRLVSGDLHSGWQLHHRGKPLS
mmetsp:Transcript_88/g.239  ORF Transcript_88/g.239 Transcript_88/m.239 type:complete len:232 (-) Transcript_88:479-1174(-)